MFSSDAVAIVGELYELALTQSNGRPLTLTERAGLARRIDHRIGEGWSATRVRAVLTNGGLDGAKLPGLLWAKRLDGMPAFVAHGAPVRTSGYCTSEPSPPRPRTGGRTRTLTADSSVLPDPNANKVRYEIPAERGLRMKPCWAEASATAAWCGRCAADARTLRPRERGGLPRPCPECHPDPSAFPAAVPEADSTAVSTAVTTVVAPVLATTPS